MRFLKVLWAVVCFCGLAAAQNFTLVSGTVIDPNGLPYALGTVSAQLVTAGTTPTLNGLGFSMTAGPANLDNTGGFTMQLASNTAMVPSTLKWQFSVCSASGTVQPAGGTGPQCFTVLVTITGATQNVSAVLSAAAPALSTPVAVSPAFSTIQAGTNTKALVEGSGGSISPAGVGQVDASTILWTIGAPAPTFTLSNGGGTFLSGHTEAIRLTLVTAAGQTLAGAEISLSNNTNGCTVGSCTITVTPPAVPCGVLPCGGYTGYSVFQIDCGGAPCTGGELAVTTCVNITASCTFGTSGTGSVVPAINTAYFQPSPQGTNLCSPGTLPQLFIQDISGSWFPYGGVDDANTGSNPPAPYNKISICRPIWINDSGTDPPAGRNSLALVYHVQNGNTVNTGNQDRGMFIYTQNAIGDATTHYGVEGLQVENDFNGTATIFGSPDGEVAAGSFQLAQNQTTGYSSNAGTQAVRASMFREGGAVGDSGGNNGINAQYVNLSSVNGGGIQGNAGLFTCNNSIGSLIAGVQCNGLKVTWSGNPNSFGNGFVGLYFRPLGTYTPGVNDYLVRTDITGMPSNFNGPVTVSQILNNLSTGTLPVTGSTVVTPSLTVSQASTGSLPGTGACSGGASAYSYNLVGVDNNGGQVVGATITGVGLSTCTNPLTVGNPATITTTMTSAQIEQFIRIDVYRSAGPMALGKVGSLACVASAPGGAVCSSFLDTGLAASGTLPTTNSTGSESAAAYLTNGTTFTASGCTNSALVGTATAGQFASGTTGACTVTITLGGFTAAHGWACAVNDQTTANLMRESASTTTTATVTGTTVTGDVIVFHCIGY